MNGKVTSHKDKTFKKPYFLRIEHKVTKAERIFFFSKACQKWIRRAFFHYIATFCFKQLPKFFHISLFEFLAASAFA